MDSDTEIDIEKIETEICAGSGAVARADTVFRLFLIAQAESEHAE